MYKLLPIVLLLAACEPSHGPALTSECKPQTIQLTVNILEKNEIRKKGEEFGIELERRDALLGFATQVKGTNRHSIYVEMPKGQNDSNTIETWGHELMHAICGDWHGNV